MAAGKPSAWRHDPAYRGRITVGRARSDVVRPPLPVWDCHNTGNGPGKGVAASGLLVYHTASSRPPCTLLGSKNPPCRAPRGFLRAQVPSRYYRDNSGRARR